MNGVGQIFLSGVSLFVVGFIARVLFGAWVEDRRALLIGPRLDTDWVIDQLRKEIARHSGQSFGRVQLGGVVVTAHWVAEAARPRRIPQGAWTLNVSWDQGQGRISTGGLPDEKALMDAVKASLTHLSGGRP